MLSLFRRFRNDEKGALSLEAVLIFPILLWGYAAMFQFWDAYRVKTVSVKAAYTIGDLISREQGTIDQAYIDGSRTVYNWLTYGRHDTALRVTVIENVAAPTPSDPDPEPQLELVWSNVSGDATPLVSISALETFIPAPAPGDQLIVTETFLDYLPFFNVGVPPRTYSNLVVTRHRFAPQVCWEATVCDPTS